MSAHTYSSEEETERIKEAIDSNFLTENLFKKNEGIAETVNQDEVLPSLRNNCKSEIVINNPFTVKVTPTYQLHVSKHLTKILEKSIDHVEVTPPKKKKRKKTTAGIKLLSTSKNYIVLDADCKKNYETKFCIAFKEGDSEDSDLEKKAKEVAVSAEWVLSQQEIKNWVSSTKGEIEIIKCPTNEKIDSKKKKKSRKFKLFSQ